jgi:hypothetical protein
MDDKRDPRRAATADAVILRLAVDRYGVVATRELRALGVTGAEISTRERAGWLRRLHRGVYAVGGSKLTWRGRWLAAVLVLW